MGDCVGHLRGRMLQATGFGDDRWNRNRNPIREGVL